MCNTSRTAGATNPGPAARRPPAPGRGPGPGPPRRDLSATALHDAACVSAIGAGRPAVKMCNDTRDARGPRAGAEAGAGPRPRGRGASDLAGAGPPGGGWAGPAGVTAVHVQRRWQRATPLTGARAHLVTARSCRVRGADAVVSTCMQGAHLVTARSCRVRGADAVVSTCMQGAHLVTARSCRRRKPPRS